MSSAASAEAIAKELGFFEDEGLFVTLEAQANWKVLLDRVITGDLDGAHMLAGQPLAATIGFGTKAVGWDNLVYGVLLVVFIIFLPKGILGSLLNRIKPSSKR